MGGPHVTFMADEALEHVDFVARGEGGEQLMLELIEALRGERSLESIRGLSFVRDGETVHNEARDRCPDLDTLPFPDLTLIHGHEHALRTTPIMTSWGCPFNCNFCSVTAMFGRQFRFRSPENVIAEIRQKQPRKIFFYDDNMAADKARLKVLLRMMIEQDLVVPWSAQVRTDVARDPELLDLMRKSGCRLVYLGLESVNQATLDEFQKSQSVDDIVAAIKKLHEYGINSHGMFVLGADSDGKQTVRDTVSFALKHHIDTVMLNILTPLPGTQQFADLDAEGRIFDKRWHLYDAHHVRVHAQADEPLRPATRGAARLHALLLVAPVAQVPVHVPLHQAALPDLGPAHHPHLAQGQAQQGLHEGPQAAAVAASRAPRPGQRQAASAPSRLLLAASRAQGASVRAARGRPGRAPRAHTSRPAPW